MNLFETHSWLSSSPQQYLVISIWIAEREDPAPAGFCICKEGASKARASQQAQLSNLTHLTAARDYCSPISAAIFTRYDDVIAEVRLSEIRKPQVEQVREPQTGGFEKDTDREPIVLVLCSTPPHSSSLQPIPAKVREFCEDLPQ
jgi:hypothetical protein